MLRTFHSLTPATRAGWAGWATDGRLARRTATIQHINQYRGTATKSIADIIAFSWACATYDQSQSMCDNIYRSPCMAIHFGHAMFHRTHNDVAWWGIYYAERDARWRFHGLAVVVAPIR